MHPLNQPVQTGNLLPHDLRNGIDQRLVNHLSARGLAHAGIPCAVF